MILVLKLSKSIQEGIFMKIANCKCKLDTCTVEIS
jgi:hypothetical protein